MKHDMETDFSDKPESKGVVVDGVTPLARGIKSINRLCGSGIYLETKSKFMCICVGGKTGII